MTDIHKWATVQTIGQASSAWLVYLLSLGSSYSFFLMLSTLLAVEDDKRIKENRSPHDTESQKVVKFYCCGNH